MKRKPKVLAGALAMTLLVGCTGTGGGATASDDAAYQMAGIARNATIATVNGKDIQAERLLFWLANAVQSEMSYGGPTSDEEWATMSESSKSEAMDAAVFYRIIESKAEENGITLTQEQEEEVTSYITDSVEESGSEEAFRASLNEVCISPEGYKALIRVRYLYENLRDKLEEDGVIAVTDSDLEQYVEEHGIYAAKHILLATRRSDESGEDYEEFSDEEKAETLQKANELRAQLAEAGDSEELFDQLMKEYSEDGRDEDGELYAPDGYTYVSPGEMVPEFEEGATALEIGEISDPIQTDYGYHIILRIPVDLEQAKWDYSPDSRLQEMLDQWVDEAEVTTTKAWDELDVKSFAEKLEAIREANTPVETEAAETETDQTEVTETQEAEDSEAAA